MKKWSVDLRFVNYTCSTVEVEAKSEEEAKHLALEIDAGNIEWDGDFEDVEVTSVEEIKE
jgi:hypothetical protein